MAGILNLVYGIVTLLVAVAGVGFVVLATGDAGDEGNVYRDWSLAVIVVLFLVVMVGRILA